LSLNLSLNPSIHPKKTIYRVRPEVIYTVSSNEAVFLFFNLHQRQIVLFVSFTRLPEPGNIM